jgi:hypothetical protein
MEPARICRVRSEAAGSAAGALHRVQLVARVTRGATVDEDLVDATCVTVQVDVDHRVVAGERAVDLRKSPTTNVT